MVLPRATTFRSFIQLQSRRTFLTPTRTQPWQRIGRRGYASEGGHEPKKASGDLPWIIGSIAVTLPTCAYLLQPSSDKGHAHEGHEDHEEHAKELEGEGEEGAEEHSPEDSKEETEAEEGGTEVGTSDTKSEQAESKHEPEPRSTDDPMSEDSSEVEDKSDESEDHEEKKQGIAEPYKGDDEPHEVESGGNVEGVQFKGATSGGTKEGKNEQGDTRKHIPDAKGGAKKRIESDYGLKQGVSDKAKATDPTGTVQKDQAAAAKPPTSHNEQSGKQEGVSNTDTKHSTDITNNPNKSRKGEGTPETSKSKGTVDPSRPQVAQYLSDILAQCLFASQLGLDDGLPGD
ncbi:MAG: hypothetical protein M1835_001769 [Candelina submexicana]|nr:MAG: hypothetical protein M1835_001769 [Candelina submexicana]